MARACPVAAAVATLIPITLDVQATDQHGERPVQHHDPYDARHHGAGRGPADGGGTRARVESAPTTDGGDHEAEDSRLDETEDEIGCIYRADQLLVVLNQPDIEAQHHHRSAKHPDYIGQHRQ